MATPPPPTSSRLHVHLNVGNFIDLPATSAGPHGSPAEQYAAIKAAGYDGIQGGDPVLCAKLGLAATTSGRVDALGEAEALARAWQSQGFACATLHVGSGIESAAAMVALAEDIVAASARVAFPLFVETHRATITQDQWRTVELIKAVPDIRFNGDFSHWYTGQEMVYRGWEKRLAFLAPVFARVRYVHGRIGNSGSIQVGIREHLDAPYVAHFKELWTRSFLGFLQTAGPNEVIYFAPELLGPKAYYARLVADAQGELVEESDRWLEALALADIARACFAAAQHRLSSSA